MDECLDAEAAPHGNERLRRERWVATLRPHGLDIGIEGDPETWEPPVSPVPQRTPAPPERTPAPLPIEAPPPVEVPA